MGTPEPLTIRELWGSACRPVQRGRGQRPRPSAGLAPGCAPAASSRSSLPVERRPAGRGLRTRVMAFLHVIPAPTSPGHLRGLFLERGGFPHSELLGKKRHRALERGSCDPEAHFSWPVRSSRLLASRGGPRPQGRDERAARGGPHAARFLHVAPTAQGAGAAGRRQARADTWRAEPRRVAPLPARASGSPSAPWRLRQNPQSVRILQPAPLPGPSSSASVTPASLLPTRSPTSGPQVCCSLHLRPLPRPCHVATAQTRPATPGAAQALGGPSPLPRPAEGPAHARAEQRLGARNTTPHVRLRPGAPRDKLGPHYRSRPAASSLGAVPREKARVWDREGGRGEERRPTE